MDNNTDFNDMNNNGQSNLSSTAGSESSASEASASEVSTSEVSTSESSASEASTSEVLTTEASASEQQASSSVSSEEISSVTDASSETAQPAPEQARLDPTPEPQPAKRRPNGALLTVTFMCAILCVASIVFAVSMAFRNNTGSFTMPEVYTPDYQYTSTVTEDNAVLLDKASVINKVIPSVVLIKTDIETATASGKGMGSGFVFTADGLIVTNAHVVANATAVTVTLYDGTVYPAEIVGSDSSTDVAVIKIDAKGLTPVDIGDSSKVVVGEDVIAMGNPYDEKLAFSSTSGMISAIRDNFHFDELGIVLDVFQHDAAINSGNSGGPLVNMYGQVIGINSVKISGYDNIGFAIEINSVINIIEDLINEGSVQRPTLGITCITETYIGGVTVNEVNENSAAEKAGIKAGDIITKIDGTRVKSTEELITMLSKHSAGDECTITVLRDAESLTMTLILDGAY